MVSKTFQEKVRELVASIPKGKVATYQSVARAAGSPKAVRAVGNAMAHNDDFQRVPCHRVISSSGELGGYSRRGYSKKQQLLAEGVKFMGEKVDLTKSLYQF